MLLPEYTAKVQTADKPNTGTNGRVWIKLRGDKGITDAMELKNGKPWSDPLLSLNRDSKYTDACVIEHFDSRRLWAS